MGCKFIVLYWTDAHEGEYKYYIHWQGEDFSEGIKNLVQCKELGYGCVKLEWRG